MRCLGLRLAGDLIDDENERGEPSSARPCCCCSTATGSRLTSRCRRRGGGTSGTGSSIRPIRSPNQPGFARREYSLKDRSMALLATRPPEEASQPAAPAVAVPVKSAHANTPPGPSPI